MTQWRLLAGTLVGALFIFSHPVRAEEVIAGSIFDEAKETDIVQKARHRMYPGGRDEENLTVQSQLPSPVRKMTPQAEEAAAADD